MQQVHFLYIIVFYAIASRAIVPLRYALMLRRREADTNALSQGVTANTTAAGKRVSSVQIYRINLIPLSLSLSVYLCTGLWVLWKMRQ